MNDNNNESMVRYLIIEMLEAAFNMALSHDPATMARLRPFAGHVIRLKTDSEELSFYCELMESGVALYAEHEGPISARIRMPVALLMSVLLGTSRADSERAAEDIRVQGDEALVAALLVVINEFSLLKLCKRILASWLPEIDSVDDLLKAVRSHEPAWMARFEHLPQVVNESVALIREQADLQRRQMAELVAIREQLDADRRASQISTIIGLCLIVVAFMAHNGFLALPELAIVSFDTAIMLIVAMVLLVPAMVRRKPRNRG